MAMRGADPVFLDTNILVYAADQTAPMHETALRSLEVHYAAGMQLWISRQVIREYVAALTRPQRLAAHQPIEKIVRDLRRFQDQFFIAEDNFDVTNILLDLVVRFAVAGKQIHDANIVATMLAYEIPTLLTHNVRDFARYKGLISVVRLSEG